MAYKISKLTEVNHHLNWMLYGLPGSGKTALAATLQTNPQTTGVLILSVEGGMLTLKNQDWGDYGPPLVVDVSDALVLEEVFWDLIKGAEGFKGIRTVVLDSLTEMASKDLEGTVRKNLKKSSKSGKTRESVDDAWLEDRGEVTSRQARLIRGFRDMPRNFVATAHPRITYARDDSNMPATHLPPLKVEPGFGDRLRQHLCGYMDYVWYLKEGNGQYVDVLTRSKGPWYAKSRAEGWSRFGSHIRWPLGARLLSDVWDTEINGKPFPTTYSTKEEVKSNE